MSYRRDHRASKTGLFDRYDDIEEGGLRASSSYCSDINEHDNDKAIDSLKDRVFFLKQLSGDIHEKVLGHNRLLDQVGSGMDASRGILSGTVDRFKMASFREEIRPYNVQARGFPRNTLFVTLLPNQVSCEINEAWSSRESFQLWQSHF